MGIFTYANAPIIVTVIALTIALIVFLYLKKSYDDKTKITQDFIEQIHMFSNDESSKVKKSSKDPVSLWCDIWGNSFKKAGWAKTEISNKRLGSLVALITGIFYLLTTIVTANFGIALMPIIAVYLFLYLFLEKAIEDRKEVFDEQVPIFLSLLKSNIRAGETPERALANAIDETEEPLYSELKNARALIDLGSFQAALNQLRKTTQSDALKFLCGCIELSTKVGANLEHQISVIEDMLESNRQLKRKLKVAISKNTPLLILSAVLIPAMFLFQYIFNEQTRAFWFKTPLSWLAFIVAIGIYLGGVFLSKAIIKKTGKF